MLFRGLVLFLPLVASATPYSGQTGDSKVSILSDNCWDNVTFSFPGKKALIVCTSHGEPIHIPEKMATGVAMEEAAVPYNVYTDAGMEVDIVSIKGGAVPHEDRPETPGVKRFLQSPAAMAKLANSSKIDDVDFGHYDVVFMAGGWGAAFDLGQSVALGTRVAAALEAGQPLIASTCHGALGFVQANKTDGTPWVKGRSMTGVTDAQIRKLGITSQTPMHPETVLRQLGARYQCVHGSSVITGDLAATSTSVDMEGPTIVTGQNQNSACVAAQRQLQFLGQG